MSSIGPAGGRPDVKLALKIPRDRPFDVVGLGLNAVDFLCVIPRFPEPNTKLRMLQFARQGGGQVATALVTCARLGLRTKYIGKVGSDDLGRFSRASLVEEGVEASDVMVAVGARSQFAVILVEGATGDRTILWDRDARLALRPDELDPEKVCAGRVLHLDGHDVAAPLQAARWARARGIPVVLDAETVKEGTAELVRCVDVLITAAGFPQELSGVTDEAKALRALARLGPSVVCVTLGVRGALALYRGRFFPAPAFKVECVDTTGAGDVFHGAFIYGMLKGWALQTILRCANAAAAMKCRGLGGRQAIPTLPELREFLRHGET